MKLSVAILTMPEREQAALPMIAKLSRGKPIEVVSGGTETSVWDSAREAWLRPHGDADYRIVLHDDAQPCDDFLAHAAEVCTRADGAPVCFYSTRDTSELQPPTPRFALFDTFTWGTALALPTARIAEFVAWCDRWVDPKWIMDDTRLALWCCATSQRIWTTAPSLVQHRPDLESLARPGKHNRESQAAWFEQSLPFEPAAWREAQALDRGGHRHGFLVSRRMHMAPDFPFIAGIEATP